MSSIADRVRLEKLEAKLNEMLGKTGNSPDTEPGALLHTVVILQERVDELEKRIKALESDKTEVKVNKSSKSRQSNKKLN